MCRLRPVHVPQACDALCGRFVPLSSLHSVVSTTVLGERDLLQIGGLNVADHVRRLMEAIAKYRLADRSPMVRTWLQLYQMGEFGEDDAELHWWAIQPLLREQERRFNGLPRAPTTAELYGERGPDVVIGRSVEASDVPIGASLHGAFHGIIAAQTGFGKTVALRQLVTAIEELNRLREDPATVCVFDYKGFDYAHLPSRFGPRWRHFDAHSSLRLGLQCPVGVSPLIWINNIAAAFSARAGLISAEATLGAIMMWLVGVLNVPGSQVIRFPDFRLILDLLEFLPPSVFASKAQYRDSLARALSDAVRASGRLFSAFVGLDLERDLISKGLSAVFSLPNIAPAWLNHFIVDLFIYQLLLGRIARRHRADQVEVVLIIDEADAIVSRDSGRLFVGALPPIAAGARQLRELGVGIWPGVGPLKPVDETLLNSVTHHVIGRMPTEDDVTIARKTLQLPSNSQSIIGALEQGEFVVRIPGPWPHAVLTKVDYVPPDRDVVPTYDANVHVPAQRLADMPDVLAAADQLRKEHERGGLRRAQQKHGQMRDLARKLLNTAAEHPYWPVVQLYKLWGDAPSFDVQKAIRRELEERKYAGFADVRVGRRNLLLIELTPEAWEFLGEPPVPLRGRGKLPHRTYANWIAMLGARRGLNTVVEWTAPGTSHAADAAWEIESGLWHAFEVVDKCDANLQGHLAALLLAPDVRVSQVTIVAAQKSSLKGIEKRITVCSEFDTVKDRIHYLPVVDILQELWA
jgi:hypothetical protein